ncbi:MAG: PepSY-like domain-containing protein [Bacteroidota bacterium]
MKRIFFALLAVTVFMASCNKEQQNTGSAGSQAVNVSSLSPKVTSYVENNYPDAYIASAFAIPNSEAKFIVTLNTTEELAFNQNGDCLGNGVNYHHGTPWDSIPGDTTNPGGGHHPWGPPHHGGPGHDSIPGDTTHLGPHGHGPHGHGPHGGGMPGGPHGGWHHGNQISVDSLPASISAYVTANFAGYSIKHAEADSSCQFGQTIDIMIFIQGTPPVKLGFDVSGNYLFTASRALYSTVPAAVSNYISSNYTGYNVMPVAEKFSLTGGSIHYAIYLAKAPIHKRVTLADDGAFICEK